ncbi:MAG: hypothetical protein VXZ72_04715, partial [Chlamydiota bacterium]|nr:hypothetical protein [Chlamydiota bacterium]
NNNNSSEKSNGTSNKSNIDCGNEDITLQAYDARGRWSLAPCGEYLPEGDYRGDRLLQGRLRALDEERGWGHDQGTVPPVPPRRLNDLFFFFLPLTSRRGGE